MSFSHTGRSSHIIHIILKESRFITAGIRSMARVFPFRSAKKMDTANTSSCGCRMARPAGFLRGCSALLAQSTLSARQLSLSTRCWNFATC
jgi:hypothetical protein